ncbi:MAG: glucoamylase family protein [Flectobacillus sp.]|uniref:glucoamylase family protein n=1 Tax=Flectobacillus sp. TaxID=50419 RepID=UPI003B9AB47F
MKKATLALGLALGMMQSGWAQQKIETPAKLVKLNEKYEYIETVQKATFQYFWDFAHPISGMAPERTATPNIVTSGGTGFGIQSIVAAVHRGWISRAEAVKHLQKMTNFLAKAERFHGAWSHWLDGRTGKMVPFGEKDNGGDLVETAYLVNGLLVAREYFDANTPSEKSLRETITKLWESVEWDWYASRGDGHLYWHWSPQYNWDMNMPIRGYNECLITYVLALGSPTHAIKPEVYQNTWKKSDFYENGKDYLGYKLSVGFPYGGPLFFAHYSYLSLDPRLMQDERTNYWQHNQAQTLINYKHCVKEAPKEFGYSTDNWGLTASDDYNFYDAHSPTNDNGTISPTAAISSFPYTPFESYQAMRYMYLKKGATLFGKYGFYDAFNTTKNWYSNQYLAIDQGPMVVMIENYRSGLLWKLGENIKELQIGLKKMGIQKPEYPTGFYMYQPDPETKDVNLTKHPDSDDFILDFAVKGPEPVEVFITDKNGKKQVLIASTTSLKGMQQVHFKAKYGTYKATILQDNTEISLTIHLK